MRDTDWIILDELHKNPNITKVAAKLYITQPTLTKRLQAMEEEFQVRIVNRSTKGVEFTPEGEFLAGRARIFLSFMKETVRGVDAFKTSGCGTVRLASSFTFSRRQLAEILMAYKSEHPNISFEIQNLRSHELTRLVEEGEADGAFVRGNYEGGINRCLVLREQAYAISRDPIALEELPDLPMLHCRLSNYSRRLLDSWWQRNFRRPPSIGATAEDVDTCCQLACRGLGYTLSFMTEEQLKNLGVHSLLLKDADSSPLVRETWFVYDGRRAKPDYVTAFIGFVEERYSIQ